MWDQALALLPPLWIAPGEESADGAAACPHGEAIRAVLSRYASVLDVPLSFHTTDSRYSPPALRDAVHVHAFALATPPSLFGVWPRVSLTPLPFAHGVPLREGAHWALAPGTHLGRGRPLSDQDGNAVGECCGTNLYSLFDLLGQEPIWVPLLLRRHLDLGLPHLLPALAPTGAPALPWEDRLRRLREETETCVRAGRARLHRAAREVYVNTSRECVADEIRFLQTDIAFLEDGVEEVARRITADTRRLQQGRRRLRQLQEGREVQAPPDQTLEALDGLPEVREARMLHGGIRVTTHPILAEYEGRRYCLGSFQVDLTENGDVRITNLTHRVGPYDHPHIYQGRPRLNSIREGMAKLLGESQFMAAIEVLVDFLKTVNPADWRLPVACWPEAGDEAQLGIPAAA